MWEKLRLQILKKTAALRALGVCVSLCARRRSQRRGTKIAGASFVSGSSSEDDPKLAPMEDGSRGRHAMHGSDESLANPSEGTARIRSQSREDEFSSKA